MVRRIDDLLILASSSHDGAAAATAHTSILVRWLNVLRSVVTSNVQSSAGVEAMLAFAGG